MLTQAELDAIAARLAAFIPRMMDADSILFEEDRAFIQHAPDDMAALLATVGELRAALNKGCNLINWSVSGNTVSFNDWIKYIGECREALGEAYQEYDARTDPPKVDR